MKEITGDVWDFYDKPKCVICIPTNGTINGNGECVMGRGVAAQAKTRIEKIALELGQKLHHNGNKVQWLDRNKCLSFPVKGNWRWNADLNIVQRSRNELIIIADSLPNYNFYLPRPGCGNGNLDYKDVRPLLLSLPDNVYVISFEEIENQGYGGSNKIEPPLNYND